jgi:adenylate cyclase
MMNETLLSQLNAWLVGAGLAGKKEKDLLRGFCERAVAAGLPLSRAIIAVDTLHPIHEGRVFRWRLDQAEEREMIEYGRLSDNPEARESWMRSPFHYLLETGGSVLHRSQPRGDPADFPILEEFRREGQTDYIAMIHRFAEGGAIGEMDCIYSSWLTEAHAGFTDPQVEALVALVPALALAIKCVSLQRIAGTLVETYLGRDPGRRVLEGRIRRGVADRVKAVLWWSDLRGFTHISDTAAPEQIIPLLNDYAEAVISAIHEAGGDVLKLIGDATLATFDATDPALACRSALDAQAVARARISAVNRRRASEGLPVTETYLALHLGEVFYGNIGSQERLDFTVIGPAVNMVNRIATMCRSAERDVLLSPAFVAALPEDIRPDAVSVGRYALRGFADAEELFTLIPSAGAKPPDA